MITITEDPGELEFVPSEYDLSAGPPTRPQAKPQTTFEEDIE
jgi:hypothetical protein